MKPETLGMVFMIVFSALCFFMFKLAPVFSWLEQVARPF